MAWTVEDCALMLDGMALHQPEEPTMANFRRPDNSKIQDGVKGMRIGVLRHFYEGDADVDPEILAAADVSLHLLQAQGAVLTTVKMGDFDTYCAVARAISWPEEFAEHHKELENHTDRFCDVSRTRLQDGKTVSAADYIQALKMRQQMIADLAVMMADVDVLVLPTMKTVAQVLGFEFTNAGNIEIELTRPFNLTGGPALALRNGFTKAGLPTSLQIIGRPFEDDRVLRVGYALETAHDLGARRPDIAR